VCVLHGARNGLRDARVEDVSDYVPVHELKTINPGVPVYLPGTPPVDPLGSPTEKTDWGQSLRLGRIGGSLNRAQTAVWPSMSIDGRQ